MANITIEEERFGQLQEAKRRMEGVGRDHQTPLPKIQRVPHHLRNRNFFAKYYSPRLVSFGPIHHGEPNLQLGEQYKLMWAAMYVDSTNKTAQDLHKKIAGQIEKLKDLYTVDAIRDFNDKNLAWMLFVDGCSLLQILYKANLYQPEVLKVKVDQLALVQQDMLLLENQLPFLVLKLLINDNDEAELMKTIEKSLQCHHLSPDEAAETMNPYREKRNDMDQKPSKGEKNLLGECNITVLQPSPTHLLDLLRRRALRYLRPYDARDGQRQDKKANSPSPTYRNIKELRAAGIRVMKSNKSRCLRNISFSSNLFVGTLKLPRIIVDDSTAPTFLNLIAYEMCPDFQNNYEISSYVEFMDSLIDHPDDVKELRSAGVLHNALGSDEEVANIFNTISTDLVPDTTIYASIRAEIETHYKKKYKTWFAQAYHTYFSNPWAIIAFIAAFLALVLTFIQTWFAIHPSNK